MYIYIFAFKSNVSSESTKHHAGCPCNLINDSYRGCIGDAPVISKRYTFNQRFAQDRPSVASRTMENGEPCASSRRVRKYCALI